jgi:hypothetical protein
MELKSSSMNASTTEIDDINSEAQFSFNEIIKRKKAEQIKMNQSSFYKEIIAILFAALLSYR